MKRLLLLTLVFCWMGVSGLSPALGQDILWPTEGWVTSTPEAQGIDSEQLAAMMAAIDDNDLDVDSVLVVRNGVLVLDAYYYPAKIDNQHELFSVTKSVLSILIGIAVDEGRISDIDEPIWGYFSDRDTNNMTADKTAITIRDLLTMTSGLSWTELQASYSAAENDVVRLLRGERDWVQYVLDKPLTNLPGTTFNYSSGSSHLLSAILQQATGLTAVEYAKEHLFGPLGIDPITWQSDPQGYSIGGWGLRLCPQDMAKIGHLYLNNGQWDNRQIVSSAWVAASTTNQLAKRMPWGDGYGYQWWIPADSYYMAMGLHGQFIFVVPDLNMVVVFTSALHENDTRLPQQLLEEYIIPAAISSEPLPAEPDGVAALSAFVEAAAVP